MDFIESSKFENIGSIHNTNKRMLQNEILHIIRKVKIARNKGMRLLYKVFQLNISLARCAERSKKNVEVVSELAILRKIIEGAIS